MQGRRTFTIAGVVALVALAASVGIAFLHMRSDEQRKRYEVFIEPEPTALLDDIDRDLDALVAERPPGAVEIQQRFDGYRPLITEEFVGC